MKKKIIDLCKADAIPEGASGAWHVKKFSLGKDLMTKHPNGQAHLLPAGNYTQLWRYTEETLHTLGELVMQDTPQELNTHMNFMMRARGRVLITGLGLGCVARGCLANPNVRTVTIIERDQHVLKLVAPHMPKFQNLEIIHADAIEWTRCTNQRFDCAWHDLWSDPDKNERHLQVLHSELFVNCARKVKAQGAWAMLRHQKRLFAKAIDLIQ